jgi:hypothetical protein
MFKVGDKIWVDVHRHPSRAFDIEQAPVGSYSEEYISNIDGSGWIIIERETNSNIYWKCSPGVFYDLIKDGTIKLGHSNGFIKALMKYKKYNGID